MRFYLRDLLWLMVVAGVLAAWFVNNRRQQSQLEEVRRTALWTALEEVVEVQRQWRPKQPPAMSAAFYAVMIADLAESDFDPPEAEQEAIALMGLLCNKDESEITRDVQKYRQMKKGDQ